MREIKFRAWDDEKELMINPLHHDLYDFDEICSYTRFNVMQFTGLHDKNGKEIYEGDILKGGIYLSYEVKWDYEDCGWNISSNTQHNFEVIGNIYENPELL